jgi:O-antigen/teichoic acid export membrane protein
VLTDDLERSMDEYYRSQMTTKLTFVIVCVALIICGFFIFIIPFLDSMSKDVKINPKISSFLIFLLILSSFGERDTC